MIKILIVNDSVMAQQALKRIIEATENYKVAGIAKDGFEGVDFVKRYRPDVTLMDIRMPNCNGVEATKKIMKTNPHPILVVTATIRLHMSYIYDCLGYGALDVVKTPVLGKQDGKGYKKAGTELIKKIKISASLKKVLHERLVLSEYEAKETVEVAVRPAEPVKGRVTRKIVAIGASTGGPTAILKILKSLPKDIRAGLILVQHIDQEFTEGLAEWFNMNSNLEIFSAKKMDYIINGNGYLAGEKGNLIVKSGYSLDYKKASSNAIYVPSIDETFKSIADVSGRNAIGVLLTGMGSDGAQGLKAIKEAGGRTIVQDEKTSLIFGMPKTAIDCGAAEFTCPIGDIGPKICELLK